LVLISNGDSTNIGDAFFWLGHFFKVIDQHQRHFPKSHFGLRDQELREVAMLKIAGVLCFSLLIMTSVSTAQTVLIQGQPDDAAPKNNSGKSVYWTASGPFYVDQQLDAVSRLIFPYNDQRRFQWLNDQMNIRLDRQRGNSYSIHLK
jgi:hypothetical protein